MNDAVISFLRTRKSSLLPTLGEPGPDDDALATIPAAAAGLGTTWLLGGFPPSAGEPIGFALSGKAKDLAGHERALAFVPAA